MKLILVATDFSTRSDRALRRACLLARQAAARILLAHVVDDDQPRRLIETQRQEATALLRDLVRTSCESDGIGCDSRIAFGEAFQGIVKLADEVEADLVVLGPHRRQVLRDSFFGTTAERSIRSCRKPVLMANGVPTGPYRTVLIATDFSEASVAAAQAAKELGLLAGVEIVTLHVLDPMEEGPVIRAAMSVAEFENRAAEAERRAIAGLETFARDLGVIAGRRVISPGDEPTGGAITNFAKEVKADLIVIGTHGRSGLEKWLLGSVAESVLSHAEVDVLAVPQAQIR